MHSLFSEMCGVEMCGSKTEHSEELCAVHPLENGEAFERVDNKEVWHPVWAGRIDDKVNSQFVKAVVDHIWRDEEVSVQFVN